MAEDDAPDSVVRRRLSPSRVRLIGVAALGIGALGLVVLLNGWSVKGPGTPSNPAIEAKWGIRISRIAVTADGGILDVRYLVLDPSKAATLFDPPDNLPVLVAEKDKSVLRSIALMGTMKHPLAAGRTYFFLFHDPGGEVERGSLVSVRFDDDLALEHVVAQ